VVVVVMPFLPGVDSWRLRIRSGALLPGFLKPPLIAGRIHDVCGTTPCQGRRDIWEFNRTDEKQQGCGQFGVTFHGSTIARWTGVMTCRFVGTRAQPFHGRPAQTTHTNAIVAAAWQ